MSNIDPFNPMPHSHRDQFDTRHGNQSGGAVWPLMAVIALLIVAGLVVGL